MEHDFDFAVLAVVSACVIVWGLLSARLERWEITAPIAFVLLGLVATHGPTAVAHINPRSSTVRSVAEVTLALVLFADASRVDARRLRHDVTVPVRLLGIGLPLSIGAGAVLAAGLFPGAGIWVVAAIGAIVAPTDAALSAPVMQDDRVPSGVRRDLNVESGLNDGIATPFVNFFLAGAAVTESQRVAGPAHDLLDLLLGIGLGLGIGLAGVGLLSLARRHRWSAPDFRPLTVLAIALFAYSAAVLAGTNGFVAAFVAGMVFGTAFPHRDELLGFASEAGTLMSLLMWFLFGAAILVPGIKNASWRDVVFALLVLTVARLVPVVLALAGSGLDRATVAFIGWFGPRGLASVVFGLLAFDALVPADARTVLSAVTVTVALSVLLHGVTASPLSARYGAYARRLNPERPERRASGPPVRTRAYRFEHMPFQRGPTNQ